MIQLHGRALNPLERVRQVACGHLVHSRVMPYLGVYFVLQYFQDLSAAEVSKVKVSLGEGVTNMRVNIFTLNVAFVKVNT